MKTCSRVEMARISYKMTTLQFLLASLQIAALTVRRRHADTQYYTALIATST